MEKCLHETIFKSSLKPKRPSRVSNHQLLGCLKPTDQPPLFVDEEMKKLNCLLLSIFNSSFNLSILSSSLFSSSCILQMSASSARYFGMFILSDFHIFECLNRRTVSFDWRLERERKVGGSHTQPPSGEFCPFWDSHASWRLPHCQMMSR